MHPGSGPSDRDNDVFFPPIREHLLASGIGVCSFDKRGVGGSTGRWQEAGILEQANDLLRCVQTLALDEELGVPVGIFGHSQGGWVVVEAASRGVPLAFVASSSGPGVTPAEQERYSLQMSLTRDGLDRAEIDQALKHLDEVVDLARRRVSFEEVQKRIPEGSWPSAYDSDQPGLWDFLVDICDYDPAPALARIEVPVLALFGDGDEIVPVEESVSVYRAAVRSDLLTVAVFPDADHRVQVGGQKRMAEGYVETLSSFVTASVTRSRR
jgi:pimeloyl-ACP methyl ester carboxylesterase